MDVIDITSVNNSFWQFDFVKDKIFGLLNLFDSTIGEDQHGSSLDMRLGQLQISYNYFIKHPIFGNGLLTTRNLLALGIEKELYKAESVIFKIMIDMGIIGIIGYLTFFIMLFRLVYRLSNIPSLLRGILYSYILGYIIYILGTGVMNTLQLFTYVFFIQYMILYGFK